MPAQAMPAPFPLEGVKPPLEDENATEEKKLRRWEAGKRIAHRAERRAGSAEAEKRRS
jgi:hypothetical protein